MNRRSFISLSGLSLMSAAVLKNSVAAENVISPSAKIFVPEPIKLIGYDRTAVPKHAWYEGKLIELGYYEKQDITIDEDFVNKLTGSYQSFKDPRISEIPLLLEHNHSILDGKLGVVTRFTRRNAYDIMAEIKVPMWLSNIFSNDLPFLSPVIEKESKTLTAISINSMIHNK